MPVNTRSVMVIVVILLVLGAIYGITLYQRGAKIQEYVVELDSDDSAALLKAIDGLSSCGRSIVGRVDFYLDNVRPQVRSRAVMVIGACGSSADSAILLPLLEGDDDEFMFVRRDVAVALGKLGGDGVVAALTKKLGDDSENVLVRAAAASSLGTLGATESIAALADALANRPAIAQPSVEEDAEEAEAPEDITLPLRIATAEALGRLATDAGVKALGEAVLENTEPSERVRAVAAYALGDAAINNENEQEMNVLLESLLAATGDSIGDVRIAAIQSLGKATLIPDTFQAELDKALTAAAADEHYWVREAAKEARRNVGPLGT